MSTSPHEDDELAALLGALREGLLTDAQRERLDHLLASDPEALRYYLEYVDLCATLRHYQGVSGLGGNDAGEGPPGPRLAPEPARRRTRGTARSLVWASAAAALMVAAAFYGVNVARRGGAGKPPQAAGDGRKPAVARDIAVLTRVIDAVWEPASMPAEVGSALHAGRLKLKSGLIQLEFYSGATVVLEGPADFELLSIDRAFCRRGKLRVRAPVRSSHFSVLTPNADVVDLGTEFGIRVDETGGSEVQVFEGSVELHGKASGRARNAGRQVLTGQGVRIDTSGASLPAEFNPESFVGARELEQRSSSEAERRYRAWQELSRKLQADPRVLVYYRFDGQQSWERTLRDQSTRRLPDLDGSIVGSQWAEGRWPGKLALDFRRTSDRVRVNIPGTFDALTLMTWVRVDDFDHRLNSLLNADGWGTPGEVHWELNGDGCLIFALKRGGRCDSPPVLGPDQLGLWTHLATVYSPLNGKITTYVNGRAVKTGKVARNDRANIGWANIGNWTGPIPPSDPSELRVRNLNGRIDEFIIFDSALDADEVRSIYEVGKPTS